VNWNKKNIATTIGSICFLVAALLYWFRPWAYFDFQKPPEPPPEVTGTEPEPEPEPDPEPEEPLIIEFSGDPKIPLKIMVDTEGMKIEADIVPVGRDSSGKMDTTHEPFGVAWYEPGSSPGWPGNAILAGHNVYNGTPGSFADLYTLFPGNEVRIEYSDGSQGLFLVQSNNTYHVNSAPASVMELRGDTRVTLIACAGERVPALGGFSHRVIVILGPIEYRES